MLLTEKLKKLRNKKLDESAGVDEASQDISVAVVVDKANDIFLQKLEKKYNVTVKNNKQRGGISEVIITNENEVYVEKACFELAKNSEVLDVYPMNGYNEEEKIADKLIRVYKLDEDDTQDEAVKPSYALYPSKGKLREVEEAISEIKNLTVSVYPLEKKINIQSYTDGVINNTLKVVKEVDPKCELMEAWNKKTVPIKNYRIDEADTSNRIFIIANYLSTEESSEVINRGAYIEKYFPNVNVKIKKTTKGLEVRVDSTELEEIKEFFYQMVYEYAYELYNYTITTGRGTYEASELKKYLDRELLNVNPLDEDDEDLYNISLDVEINHYNVSEPEKTLHNIEKFARNNNVSFDLTNWETDVADYAISGDTYSNIEKVFKSLIKAGVKITNYTFNKEYSKDKKAIKMTGYKMLDKYVNKKSSKINPLNEAEDEKYLAFKIEIYGKQKIENRQLGFAMNEDGGISGTEYKGGNTFITLEINPKEAYLLKDAIYSLTEDWDYNILNIEYIGNEKNKYYKKAIGLASMYLKEIENNKENKISGLVYFYNKKYKFTGKEYSHYGDISNKELSNRWSKEMGGTEGPEDFYEVYISGKTDDEFLKECEDLVKKGSKIVGFQTSGNNKMAKKYSKVIKYMLNKYKVDNKFIKSHLE